MSDEDLLPLKRCQDVDARFPRAWDYAVEARGKRDSRGHPGWQDWCFVPRYVMRGPLLDQACAWSRTSRRELDLGDCIPILQDTDELTALAAWRGGGRVICRFDPDLYQDLVTLELSPLMPASLLFRLPAVGLYVETPGLVFRGIPVAGFYAHLDDAHSHPQPLRSLRLMFETADRPVYAALYLSEKSLERGLGLPACDRCEQEELRDAPENLRAAAELFPRTVGAEEVIRPAASLLAYLCSERPDIAIADGPVQTAFWQVGDTLGAAVRAVRESCGGLERLPIVRWQVDKRPRAEGGPRIRLLLPAGDMSAGARG